MQDGALRRLIKRVARAWFELALSVDRGIRTRRGEHPYRLGGFCEKCARCCDEPAIQIGKLMWYLPLTQALFLWWQRVVNGFVLSRSERESRTLFFECTHFDKQTRRCDSYHSRPGICRDYPRLLMYQPRPDLFDECGYRPIARNANDMLRVLNERNLSDEQLAKLKKELYLE